ncbi:MAG: S8 family serine peptidase [Rhizonema sp. PD37]|nr:S8 family serine peptidase [Rhizonema sp. PD37]
MQVVQKMAAAIASAATSFVVIQVRPAIAASLDLGSALTATGVETARHLYNVDGSGIKIGVISNSFNTASTVDQFGNRDTYVTDVANGYLPPNIQVLQDYNGPGAIDEGRVLLEIIHAVAPGASLAFASAYSTSSITSDDRLIFFANEIRALKAAGANIIVDDIEFYNPPYNTSLAPIGPIDQVIESVFDQGTIFFTSAGNEFSNPTKPIFNFKNDQNVATVGAVYYGNPNISQYNGRQKQGQLEPFSSMGIPPYIKPDFSAPDGLDISFNLGQNARLDTTTGFYSFFGTSAAAPFAAAVGSLILQADPDATPTEVYSAIRDTAKPLKPTQPGFHNRGGYGLIQADKAITYLGVKPKLVPESSWNPVLLTICTLGIGLLGRRSSIHG